jgi:hypothetical protein
MLNGELFRNRIDRRLRPGGGKPAFEVVTQHEKWEHFCAIDSSFQLVRHTPPAPRF